MCLCMLYAFLHVYVCIELEVHISCIPPLLFALCFESICLNLAPINSATWVLSNHMQGVLYLSLPAPPLLELQTLSRYLSPRWAWRIWAYVLEAMKQAPYSLSCLSRSILNLEISLLRGFSCVSWLNPCSTSWSLGTCVSLCGVTNDDNLSVCVYWYESYHLVHFEVNI